MAAQEKGKMQYPEAGIVPVSLHEENIANAASGWKVTLERLDDGKQIVLYPDSRVTSSNKLGFSGQARDTGYFRIDPETGEVDHKLKVTAVIGVNLTYSYSNYTCQQLRDGKHRAAKK